MSPETIYRVSQEAMVVAVKLTAPVLIPSLVVGLIIAMFQAATQINEMTLTFVPKLIVIGIVLMVMGPWMLQMYLDYFQQLIKEIPDLIG
ncbi:MAG: flagellar biosynthesis protein FliQ [Gammaproteobacteria bacterium]